MDIKTSPFNATHYQANINLTLALIYDNTLEANMSFIGILQLLIYPYVDPDIPAGFLAIQGNQTWSREVGASSTIVAVADVV
jgi:hypothetical protein